MGSCDSEPAAEEFTVSWKLFLGIFMSVAASIIGNFGANMQKFSQMVEEVRVLPAEDEAVTRSCVARCCAPSFRRPYILLWRWWIGMFGAIGGGLGDFAALALAPQSVCSPIGSTTLVANLFFATLWLKEKLRWIDLLGTTLVIAGAVLSVVFGSKTSRCYVEDELKASFQQPLMIVYLILCWSTIVVSCVACEIGNCLVRRKSSFYRIHLIRAHAILYSLLAGVMCSQSIMFGKALGSLLLLTLDGVDPLPLEGWFFWVSLLAV